jgi:hypothetical protein
MAAIFFSRRLEAGVAGPMAGGESGTSIGFD